jgi:hypothetical protein
MERMRIDYSNIIFVKDSMLPEASAEVEYTHEYIMLLNKYMSSTQ